MRKPQKICLCLVHCPGYTGFTDIIDNVGSVENKGLEFTVGGDPLVGSLKWNTGFNISANKSKVLNLEILTDWVTEQRKVVILLILRLCTSL